MTRRTLFALPFAAFAGSVLDPERLLWVPGRKTISIPAMKLWSYGGMVVFPVYTAQGLITNETAYFKQSGESLWEYRFSRHKKPDVAGLADLDARILREIHGIMHERRSA